MTEHKRRVKDLESKTPKSEPVIGVIYENTDIVRITGSGEELTKAEFESKYPDGVLLFVKYEETRPTI